MKAIDLLKNAELQHFQKVPPEFNQSQTFNQHWKKCISGIAQLEVDYKHVCGRGAVVDNNSPEFMEALEGEVVDGGFWVYMYDGHDGMLEMLNYENRQDAVNFIWEHRDNPYITSIFILSDVL